MALSTDTKKTCLKEIRLRIQKMLTIICLIINIIIGGPL